MIEPHQAFKELRSTRNDVNQGSPDLARFMDEQLDKLEADYEALKKAAITQASEIEQTLGKALGYPWYKDDQVNFPGATEVNGVCVGDNVAESLAMEAANRLTDYEAAMAVVRWVKAEIKMQRDRGQMGTVGMLESLLEPMPAASGYTEEGEQLVAATATIERLTGGINNLTDALELIPCPNDKLYPNGGNPCACQVFPKERVRHALDAILQAGLALRAAEWAASTRSATDGYSSNYACCPSCGGMKDTALFGYTPGEHRGGCEIASALADPTLAAILKEHDEVERSVK